MLRTWLALLLAVAPFASCAAAAVFYQPQLRDMQVPDAQWAKVFALAREHGFDTAVLQWTRYGTAFQSKEGQDWLRERILDARAQGLRVVVGLHADPDFYSRQYLTGRSLESYFRSQRQIDARLAREWVSALGASNIAGWYLASEVDDLRWQDAPARRILLDHLTRTRQALVSIAPVPVFNSSFFVANSSAAAYHELIRELTGTGVRTWVQDGAGTGKLPASQRQLYLDTVSQCAYGPAGGIVFELFRQSGPDEAFSAERLPQDEFDRAIGQRASCAGDSVFFSLRYLPAMDGLVPL